MKLVVGGGLTLDGTVEANGGSSFNNNPPASGGSVWITAGMLSGAGSVLAKAGESVNAPSGGSGGRISLMLTEQGADFSGFTGKEIAYGWWCSNIGWSNKATANRTCGTVYFQTGDESLGYGTVLVSNDSSIRDQESGTMLPSASGASADELKYAVLKVDRNATVILAADLKVHDFAFTDAAGKIDLAGHVLKVDDEWRDYSADKAKFLNAGEWIDGKKPGYANVRWKTAGLSVLIK